MIGTFLRVSWIALARDRIGLLLTFVLPIVFFSIFSLIFAGMGGAASGAAGAMRVIVVDEDDTETSRRFVAAIDAQQALDVMRNAPAEEGQSEGPRYTSETARARVRRGGAPAAIIVPTGFGKSFGDFVAGGAAVELVYDAANPLAQNVVGGLLQAAAFRAAPELLMDRGMEWLERASGEDLTPSQQRSYDVLRRHLSGELPWDDGDTTDGAGAADDGAGSTTDALSGLIRVEAHAAREATDSRRRSSIVSYYAAGIGVMFLLFTAAGVSGSLLEEKESGALERLLTSNVSMATVLLGKWAFFALVGLVQLVLMFVWGWALFGLELFTPSRLAGFAAMSLVTTAAASSFGLLLASVCRTRAQHGGISTVVILIMSALGGSMVPRFVMPKFMNTTALFTFNGWALDGYLKVFWYDDPAAGVTGTLASLWPQLLVLGSAAAVFLVVARHFSRRWEVV
jgi:ABC-2 type transport system permease protein